MRKIFHSAAFLLAGLIPAQAMANADAGLYDPAPPEGSAFVRFMRDQNVSGSEPVKANGKIYDYLDFKEVSSYFVVPQGKVKVELGSTARDFNAESGKFYTVIANDTGNLDIKTDPENANQAKAQVILYNLSEEDGISLKTADGVVDVVPPLSQGQSSERQINPVKVPLAVYKGGEKIKDLGTLSLDRSQSYSAVVLDGDNVTWIRSTTNTTR